MKNIITPFLHGLKSPFVGNQAPDSSQEDSKSQFPGRKTSLANLKSSFLSHKLSFGDFKPPFLGRKISLPLFEGFKSPFPGAKASRSSLRNARSHFAPFASFKSFKSPFTGRKEPDATTTEVPVPVPIPDKLHIPPYHHQIDYEVGFYDDGDAFDAFKSSFPNMAGGYEYIEINLKPGFGEPLLLGLPVNVRFRIYEFMTRSVLARNKKRKILLSPDRTVYGFWPDNSFMEPGSVFDIIGSLSLACFQLRHEVLTYYCSQFHFHVSYDYFCSPLAAPLIHKWLPLFANRMQFLTVEIDFTHLGGCYKNDKCVLTDGQREIMWFMRKLVLALKDRKGAIRSLHIMCRRYKGFRPPSQKIPEKKTPDDTESSPTEPDEDGTASLNNTPTSSVIAQPSHGECSHLTDEPPEDDKTPRKDGPIKYCPSPTTAVLGILTRYLGWAGTPLYHFRLSGFSRAYTKKILTDVSSIGAGPPFLMCPRVPPWPRDYPEIGRGITTTDANYLGTIVKLVSYDKQVERPPTGVLAASRMFLRRAISRMSFARTTPNIERSENNTPYPEYDGLSTIEDSDAESDSEIITGNKKQPEGLGLGIQLPTQNSKFPLPLSQNSKHPLMSKYKVAKDIDMKLEEPDLPKDPPVNELWAIHSVSTRFGELFGVDTATRGLPKEKDKPPGVDSMHTAIGVLYTVPENPVVTPSISVMSATVPDIQDQLHATLSTFDGRFNPPQPPPPASGWRGMNRLWRLGREHENISQQGLHTVVTNSTLYTDASESTLDMAFSDPTIPPQSRMPNTMHEQEIDSSSTLYVPADGSETPTMARSNNEERGQAEELPDHGEEELDLSQLGLHHVATGSTFSGYSTGAARSRSNTDDSVALDWPLPNPIPMAPPQPTRPAPPVPEVHDELQQVPTVSSRRTVQFSDNDQLQQIPSALSRRTVQFADTDVLQEIHPTSSRRTLRFAVSEEDEAARIASRTPNSSFYKKRREEQVFNKRIEALDSLFHDSGAPAAPKEKQIKEKTRSASVSGRFFSRGNSQQDGEDRLSRPALRNAVSFTGTASTRPVLPQRLKARASRLFNRKKEEPKKEGPEDGEDMAPAPNPFLRSVRSISSFVNPRNLRRSRSTLTTNAEQLNEEPTEPSTEPAPVPSVPSVPAAAPEPEPRRRLFGLLQRHPKTQKPKPDAHQIAAMSSSLSLLFNDSSVTVGDRGAVEQERQVQVPEDAGGEPVVAAAETDSDSDSSTETVTPAPPSRLESPASTTRPGSSARPGYHSFVRPPPGGGSIFGPRGGRRDGRGSLAGLSIPEREARMRAGREKGGVRDRGQLGLNRVGRGGSSGYGGEGGEEDDGEEEGEEGGYVV